MKSIVIIGAGGWGREVKMILDRINDVCIRDGKDPEWNVLGYFDDSLAKGTAVNDKQVLGSVEDLAQSEDEINIALAIGSHAARKKIIEKLKTNSNIKYPAIIDPSAVIAKNAKIGNGTTVNLFCIISDSVTIGEFSLINSNTILGHDVVFEDYSTVFTGACIAGNCHISKDVEIGQGALINPGKKICSNVTIGAGAVVSKDITESGTYVGCPCKKIK